MTSTAGRLGHALAGASKTLALLLLAAPAHADTTTIDQLVTIAGAPTNQLYGYGLVVGLPGSGDQTTEVPYTQQ